ncbi:MAG: adenylate/guanylate cyclase domain-containing protein [Anaerolineales bacterium]
MWTLTLRSSDGKPKYYTLNPGRNTIGRGSENDLIISEISASRSHAEILFDPEENRLMLRDLGSTNGTYVNRDQVEGPRPIKHNDIIRIGESLISVTNQELAKGTTPKPMGTRSLTRDFVLESLDHHAVLMYEVARKMNSIMDLDTALAEVSAMMQRAMGADRCEVILAEQFDLLRVRSAICVPISTGEELLGIIYMYKTSPTEPPFNDSDLQLAVAISHQSALTVQRMHLLEQVREEQRLRQLLERFVTPQEVDDLVANYQNTGYLSQLAERTVTILFADIMDSTGLAERLEPRRFGEMLNRYYQYMTDIIFQHGGLVDKYLGDGVMAVFGMNPTDETDPEGRAVRSGLEMLERVRLMREEEGEDIHIGVGINTGTVVAGYVHTQQRVEFTVLGDVVNVAAGLQAMARPDRIFIGPATAAGVVGRFVTQRIGAVSVKGRLRELQSHEVLGPEEKFPVE